ncbi:HD-GYP domain-containing protein [Halorhodospira neutriphila]|uniref:HD-GYP domain-containing protein n=1 Tax=Halorhodospira neutriphila TaxID=168379 RepID=A0ABS1E754_9GAMM|nr:HD-GYP domain-containing protein [Halorhodospira neutriphila]MBK1727054.1 hypothetical protein [Halorhodospira neutriphila]
MEIAQRIRVEDLAPGMYVVDLGVSWAYHPFLHNQFRLDRAAIERIRELGIEEVVVLPPERPEGEGSEPLAPDGADASPAQEGIDSRLVTMEARSIVSRLLREVRAGRAVDRASVDAVVSRLNDALGAHQDSLLALGRIRSRDGYTYQHSVNVGVLLMAFGRYLNLDPARLHELGVAGLFHDVGKAFVPLEILTKPGRLTESEYEIVKLHALKGANWLRGLEDASELMVRIAERHHERLDGAGYPHGLQGEALGLEERMAMIVDVYDALTAIRPYHKGYAPVEALRIITQEIGQAFDRELVYEFIRCIGVYPPGTLVRLSDGYLAVVLEANHTAPGYPRVRVVHDARRNRHLRRYEDRDLADGRVSVEGHEDPGRWFFRPEDCLAGPAPAPPH